MKTGVRGQLIELTGERFGKLTVISFAARIVRNGGSRIKWLCQCDCGEKCEVESYKLRSGHTQSCGCHQRKRAAETQFRHGGSASSLYDTWRGMIDRCTNANSENWHRYGGRGITICYRWLDFVGFKADMGGSFVYGLTLERINNDGNYEPSNCRWATMQEQAQNKNRRSVVLFHAHCL